MIKVIINADDFGFSKSVNEGIMYAFDKGLISTTTMMMNQPFTGEACELWKANPQIAVGLHINLVRDKPVLNKQVSSIVDANGDFYNRKLICNEEVSFEYSDVYDEIEAQLLILMQHGEVDHMDAHCYSSLNSVIRKAMHDVARRYNLPVRIDNNAKPETGILTTQKVLKDFYGENAKAETIKNFIENYRHLESLEIMCHVGFIDEDTRARTSYLTREEEIRELEKLKNEEFYDTFELITFKQLEKK